MKKVIIIGLLVGLVLISGCIGGNELKDCIYVGVTGSYSPSTCDSNCEDEYGKKYPNAVFKSETEGYDKKYGEAGLAGMYECTCYACPKEGSEQIQEETKESAPEITQVNADIIISGIDFELEECVVSEINLWDSPDTDEVVAKIEDNVCGGLKVNAFEISSEYRDRTWYHIRTADGKEGWITDSFVAKDGICETNSDCENLKDYSIPDICFESICVKCATTEDCSRATVCHPQKYECVQCISDENCLPDDPNIIRTKIYCNMETDSCVECLTNDNCAEDKQCSYGVCMKK